VALVLSFDEIRMLKVSTGRFWTVLRFLCWGMNYYYWPPTDETDYEPSFGPCNPDSCLQLLPLLFAFLFLPAVDPRRWSRSPWDVFNSV